MSLIELFLVAPIAVLVFTLAAARVADRSEQLEAQLRRRYREQERLRRSRP